MTRRRTSELSLLLVLLTVGACRTAAGGGTPDLARSADQLTLELLPEHQEDERCNWPRFRARLVNRSKRTVLVLRPGEGCLDGLRPPALRWALGPPEGPLTWQRQPRPSCPQIGRARPAELVTLAPGESVLFDSWLGGPIPPEQGWFRAALEYECDPGTRWSELTRSRDPALLGRSPFLTACRVRSESVLAGWWWW